MNYRPMRSLEVETVCALVKRVFRGFVAPLYGPEGVAEFESYLEPDKLRIRWEEGNLVLVAEEEGELMGVIEIRDQNHICLFFVDGERQGKCIGRTLLNQALEVCRDREPGLAGLTVNSSPNSVTTYRRFGFSPKGPEQTKNGITFVPMELALTPGKEDDGPSPSGQKD